MKKRMKRMLAASLLLASATMQAQDFQADGLYYKIVADGTVKVVSGAGSQESYQDVVDVPPLAWHNGQWHKVTGIGEGAFRNCKKLIAVTLPICGAHIGKSAFEGSSVKTVSPNPTTLSSLYPSIGNPTVETEPQVVIMPSERLVEKYAPYFTTKRNGVDKEGLRQIVTAAANPSTTKFTVCFDGLYGIVDDDAVVETAINKPGYAFEAEDMSRIEIQTSSDGKPATNVETVKDASASGGAYIALSAVNGSAHTQFSFNFQDMIPSKHYNVYCTFAPTPSGLPALFTSSAKTGGTTAIWMLPQEDQTERIPEELRSQSYLERAYATTGTQMETMCIALDLKPDYWKEAMLNITSFGPSATRLKEKVYTRTLCIDRVEVRVFNTSEEAQADYEQWKSNQK